MRTQKLIHTLHINHKPVSEILDKNNYGPYKREREEPKSISIVAAEKCLYKSESSHMNVSRDLFSPKSVPDFNSSRGVIPTLSM